MSERRTIHQGSGRTAESFDTYGHNVPKPVDYTISTPESQVPHEDVDTDDQRKSENRWRHSSYRK